MILMDLTLQDLSGVLLYVGNDELGRVFHQRRSLVLVDVGRLCPCKKTHGLVKRQLIAQRQHRQHLNG